MLSLLIPFLLSSFYLMIPSEAVELLSQQSVYAAIDVVTTVHGRPEYAGILRRICWRESRCKWLPLHAIDRKYSPSVWRYAVQRRRLEPRTCRFHRDPSQWSTSGAFGLMRGYHWHFIGSPCLPPWVLDIPPVSAYVAYQKLFKGCRSHCSYKNSLHVWRH